jgi:predicted transposase YbfD/YdcC
MEREIPLQTILRSVELKEDHKGYYYNVTDILLITLLGIFCGLRDLKRIHQWAESPRNAEFLSEEFGIHYIPCYSWFTVLLGMIKPESLDKEFRRWVRSILPEKLAGMTAALDGKTVCSTEKMKGKMSPLHIVSIHVSELGIVLGQAATEAKSNEIPTAQELLKTLELQGLLVVADALNCQKETAEIIVSSGGDYLLSVKGNQKSLETDIAEYVQDDDLRGAMDTAHTRDVRGDRVELRTAFTTTEVDWIPGIKSWENLTCIGAVHTEFSTQNGNSDEWHYYISSRPLTAAELLKHARAEWGIETMHWHLDVNFGEDGCKIRDDDVQKNLNVLRKIVLNCMNSYKSDNNLSTPVSELLFSNLLDCHCILPLLHSLLLQN